MLDSSFLEFASVPVRLILFLALAILPGAWISMGSLGRDLSLNAALAIAVTLSPAVLLAPFYVLRLFGLPFDTTAVVLAIVNLPAFYLVLKRLRAATMSSRRGMLLAGFLLAVPLAFLLVLFHDLQIRAAIGHAWLHADIVHRLWAGDLRPEEAALAGVPAAYPWGWAGHVYQALHSWALNAPPVFSYAWTNLLWLLATFGAMAAAVARLGGDGQVQALACVMLAFAVNPLGLALRQALPPDLLAAVGPYLGDGGYTPWLRKYYGFDQMPLALGSLAAVFLIAMSPREFGGLRHALLLGLQLCALGIVYPPLLPAGGVIVIARIAADTRRAERANGTLALAAAAVLATVAAAAAFSAAGSAPWASIVPSIDSLWDMRLKAIKALVALSLPILGFAVAARRLWVPHRTFVVSAGLAAILCVLIYVTLDIPFWRNEYKYILAAALVLAPFPAIALGPVLDRAGFGGPALAVAVVLALAVPPAWQLYCSWPPVSGFQPSLSSKGLDLGLAPTEAYAGALDAIRRNTPPDTVLVAGDSAMHLPTLTQRSQFAPYASRAPLAGYIAGPNFFLTRDGAGHGALIAERRAVLHRLFEPVGATARDSALAEMQSLRRPLAILIALPSQALLLSWLEGLGRGAEIYRDSTSAVWLLPVE